MSVCPGTTKFPFSHRPFVPGRKKFSCPGTRAAAKILKKTPLSQDILAFVLWKPYLVSIQSVSLCLGKNWKYILCQSSYYLMSSLIVYSNQAEIRVNLVNLVQTALLNNSSAHEEVSISLVHSTICKFSADFC